MIQPPYAAMMARYNAWQNNQLLRIVEVMDEPLLHQNRGAFFGSVLGTLNHILWADLLWLSRFDPRQPAPQGRDTEMCPTGADWAARRKLCDAAIMGWADTLNPQALDQDLSWFSGILQSDVHKPMAACVMHFFNHQTHHRGQVHAMLTAAGHKAPVTDLVFMPEDL